VTRHLSPLKLAGAGLLLLAITLVILWQVPSNDFILLPDKAHAVAPYVSVQGGHEPSGPGGIYYVDVFEKRASLLEQLFPDLVHSGASLVPAVSLVPPGTNDRAMEQAQLREMSRSQQIAAAVALRQLGYHVVARPNGVIVDTVFADTHAVGKLIPTDVIVSVNGTPVRTVAGLRRLLGRVKIGAVVRLGVRRGSRRIVVHVQTVASPDRIPRPIVGFLPDQSVAISLPIRVHIDVSGVGGPSAGLAFALQVMEELGRNVDRGYRIAATGQIEPDGTVTSIGGVKQKTFGVREANVDVFLVPAGDNAKEAKRYAHGLRIVPVKTFQQALHALATLPPRQ
jgi:PDZ domain-containing protein